jgi:hypothetical protein
MAGASENDPLDMGRFISSCGILQRLTGAAVMAIHHVGKDASRGGRGHSSLFGAIDVELTVEKIGEANRFTVTKSKDDAMGDSYGFDLKVVDLGQDDGGDEIRSCVVVPSDEPAHASQRRSLSPQQREALDCLKDVLARAGTIPPASDHIPPGRPVVSEQAWREAFYSRTFGSDSPDAKQKAFRRAADMLKGGGYVGLWQASVWVIE